MTHNPTGRAGSFIGLLNIPEVSAKSSFITRVCVWQRERGCLWEFGSPVVVKSVPLWESSVWVSYESHVLYQLNQAHTWSCSFSHMDMYAVHTGMGVHDCSERNRYTTNLHRDLHLACDSIKKKKKVGRVHFRIFTKYTVDQWFTTRALNGTSALPSGAPNYCGVIQLIQKMPKLDFK